jgi:hypothetical protein
MVKNGGKKREKSGRREMKKKKILTRRTKSKQNAYQAVRFGISS